MRFVLVFYVCNFAKAVFYFLILLFISYWLTGSTALSRREIYHLSLLSFETQQEMDSRSEKSITTTSCSNHGQCG